MPHPRIVTVTMNPAVDHVLEARQFTIGAHMSATRLGWYPAGKGINVARTLGALGSRVVATGFVGHGELGLFEEYLERAGQGRVVMQLLTVRGRTRDNITIVDPVYDTETHIRDEGFTIQHEDARRLTSKVSMLARDDAVVCFSGSLPPGFTTGDLRTMLHRCQTMGAKIIVDTHSDALDAVRDEPVWMLKLNAREASQLTGVAVDIEPDRAVEAARSLLVASGGPAQVVIITRGPAGAVLVTHDLALAGYTFVHPGRIANTVGCGDALLAGVLHAWAANEGWEAVLRSGVAVATANAVARVPGELSHEDVEEFSEAATIDKL
jgi:1-phosphofructokinase family hexose kinase